MTTQSPKPRRFVASIALAMALALPVTGLSFAVARPQSTRKSPRKG